MPGCGILSAAAIDNQTKGSSSIELFIKHKLLPKNRSRISLVNPLASAKASSLAGLYLGGKWNTYNPKTIINMR